MLDIIIPVIDNRDLTIKCLDHLFDNAKEQLHIILIDNASVLPYTQLSVPYPVSIVRNARNVGMIESLRQGMVLATSEHVIYMHNDVFIQEKGFDTRIIRAFEDDEDLALLGFFGALGIGADGGRIYPFSNMVGKEIGSHGREHGSYMNKLCYSAVLDGLALIFNKAAYDSVGLPCSVYHHFYDKMIPLHYWLHGWKVATIGIAFDHGSGFTSNSSTTYRNDAALWLAENNIPVVDNNTDMSVYLHAESVMFNLYGDLFPCAVTPQGTFVTNTTLAEIRQNWQIR